MKKTRMYFSFINEQKHKSAKSRAADRHNLRLDQEHNPNFNPDLTPSNLLYINGEPVDPANAEENFLKVEQLLADDVKQYNDLNEVPKATDAKERANARSGLVRSLKSWIDSDKTTEPERQFWQGIQEAYDSGEVLNSAELLQDFEGLGLEKIASFKHKIKRLEGIEAANPRPENAAERLNPFSVMSKELLFKIPDDYGVNLDPDDWIKSTRNIREKLFPEFKSIYEAVHCDENPENSHIHIRISGFNNQTGRFDIGDALLNNLRENYGLNIDKGKKYADLSYEELKQYGEKTQDVVFDLFNQELKETLDNKYKIDVVKRTPEEVEADPRTFDDRKLASFKRLYNNNQKNLEIIKKQEEQKQKLQRENGILQVENKALKGEVKALRDGRDKFKKQAIAFRDGRDKFKSQAKTLKDNRDKIASEVHDLTVRKIELTGEVDGLMTDVKKERIKLQNIETAYESAFKTIGNYIKAIGKGTVDKLKELYSGYRGDVDYIGGYKPDIADKMDKATIENIDKALDFDHSEVIGLIERKQLENDREVTKTAIAERQRMRSLFKPR